MGIGLVFEEVDSALDADIRIVFMHGDGSWSYIGRDIWSINRSLRTMNFGWNISQAAELDTAIHEIGHTLGFYHEHQNPHAGIVWNEEAVYEVLSKPPRANALKIDSISAKLYEIQEPPTPKGEYSLR